MSREPVPRQRASRLLPRVVRWALAVLLPGDEWRAAASELGELYELRRRRHGERSARKWLWRQAWQYPHRVLIERVRTAPRKRAPSIPRRHTRVGEPVQNLSSDLKHSLRGLVRAPLLTATIVATVGLGIGTTTVLFSVVHSVLIAPLPYQDSGDLYLVYWDRAPFHSPMSVADYLALEEHQTSFEQVEGYTYTTVTFHRGEVAERVGGKRVTPGYLSLLGVTPGRGRDFDASDGRPGTEPAVIVSQGFWRRQLNADPALVGRTIRLDGVEHRLVGVLPAAAGPLEERIQVIVATQWPVPPRRGPFFIRPLGRLRDGVDPAAAAEEVQAINRRIFPLWESTYQDDTTEWGLVGLKEEVVGRSEAKLLLSLAAVALVLLIACANAANLLVARAIRRHRELAIRGALGASRGRLLQHLLSESALLALGTVAVGLALTVSGMRLLRTVGADDLPRSHEIALDGPVVLILLATTVVSGLLFGLLPALFGSRSRIDRTLPSGGRSATGGVAAGRLRHGLVGAQLAVATPLLIAAGLLVASLEKLQRVDLGVDSRDVLTAAVLLPARSYPESSDVLAFWERARERVAALPGVVAVGYSDGRPPNDTGMTNNFFLEDHPTPPGEPDPAVPWVAADEGYFEALGISLAAGRLLDERDGADGMNAIVVDQAWSRRFFPDSGALGRRVRQGGCPSCPYASVVGVVTDVRYNGLDHPHEGIVYWPMADRPVDHQIEQITQRFRYLVIRTAVEPMSVLPAVRSVVSELDAALPLSRVATLEELTASSLEQPRTLSVLVATFAVVALLLSVIGIYGVMSYFVEQHSRDIGIRIALGGRPLNVLGMVVGRGMRVAAVGLVVGLAGAVALTRFMSGLLFEVAATDAATFAGVSTVMLASALLACFLPARRAAGLDPATTLREE